LCNRFSSRFDEQVPAVVSFAYQEAENDPRHFAYLWVVRGPTAQQSMYALHLRCCSYLPAPLKLRPNGAIQIYYYYYYYLLFSARELEHRLFSLLHSVLWLEKLLTFVLQLWFIRRVLHMLASVHLCGQAHQLLEECNSLTTTQTTNMVPQNC